MFQQLIFSNVHPACHNIANGIKPGSDYKKTDTHAADWSKAVCWDVKFPGRKVNMDSMRQPACLMLRHDAYKPNHCSSLTARVTKVMVS